MDVSALAISVRKEILVDSTDRPVGFHSTYLVSRVYTNRCVERVYKYRVRVRVYARVLQTSVKTTIDENSRPTLHTLGGW